MDRTIVDVARQTVSNLFAEKLAAKASPHLSRFWPAYSRHSVAAIEAEIHCQAILLSLRRLPT